MTTTINTNFGWSQGQNPNLTSPRLGLPNIGAQDLSHPQEALARAEQILSRLAVGDGLSLRYLSSTYSETREHLSHFTEEGWAERGVHIDQQNQSDLAYVSQVVQGLRNHPQFGARAQALLQRSQSAQGLYQFEGSVRRAVPLIFSRTKWEMAGPVLQMTSSIMSTFGAGIAARYLSPQAYFAVAFSAGSLNALYQIGLEIAHARHEGRAIDTTQALANMGDALFAVGLCSYFGSRAGIRSQNALLRFAIDIAAECSANVMSPFQRILNPESAPNLSAMGLRGLGYFVAENILSECSGDMYGHGARRFQPHIQNTILNYSLPRFLPNQATTALASSGMFLMPNLHLPQVPSSTITIAALIAGGVAATTLLVLGVKALLNRQSAEIIMLPWERRPDHLASRGPDQAPASAQVSDRQAPAAVPLAPVVVPPLANAVPSFADPQEGDDSPTIISSALAPQDGDGSEDLTRRLTALEAKKVHARIEDAKKAAPPPNGVAPFTYKPDVEPMGGAFSTQSLDSTRVSDVTLEGLVLREALKLCKDADGVLKVMHIYSSTAKVSEANRVVEMHKILVALLSKEDMNDELMLACLDSFTRPMPAQFDLHAWLRINTAFYSAYYSSQLLNTYIMFNGSFLGQWQANLRLSNDENFLGELRRYMESVKNKVKEDQRKHG